MRQLRSVSVIAKARRNHPVRERRMRRLVFILGDQLDVASPALADFEPGRDRALMNESAQAVNHVWNHNARIALFHSAMRHFALSLQASGMSVDYAYLTEAANVSLADILADRLAKLKPEKLAFGRALGILSADRDGEHR